MGSHQGLGRSVLQGVLWTLLLALAVLPLINNMNDILAKVTLATGLHVTIEKSIVPAMTNMVSMILRFFFKIENLAVGGSIYIQTIHGFHNLYIGWNCVGWQSLILLLFSGVTGLAGDWTPKSKLKCALLGLEGLVVINFTRIVAIALVLLRWGPGSAVMFHDHLSQLLTFAWLAVFWYVSNEFMLEPNWDGVTWGETIRDIVGTPFRVVTRGLGEKRIMGLATLSILVSSVVLSGFAFYAGVNAIPEYWWDTDWDYRKLVTVNSAQVVGIHTDFPVLFSGTYSDLNVRAKSDGSDIRFVSYGASPQVLDYEIESYGSGTIVAWVEVDVSDAADTDFWIYYGNDAASSGENPNGVWDSSFEMVQHLEETSGTHQDSTLNDNDGAPNGGLDQTETGKMDGADYFDGSDDYVSIPKSTVDISGDFTVEIWIDKDDKGAVSDNDRLFSLNDDGSNGFQLALADSSSKYGVQLMRGGSSVVNGLLYGSYDTSMTYIAYVVSGSTGTFYRNGQTVSSDGSTTITIGSTYTYDIGLRGDHQSTTGFKGVMDEARISSSARTGNWIQTSYSSMNDPSSFYDIDVEIEISENLIHLLLPALAIPSIIGLVVRKTRPD